MAETAKALNRRLREGFFERYMHGRGIDIGCGDDPVTPTCERWDWEQGDAHDLEGGPWDWIYSSHCLEHLADPRRALRNWGRRIVPGGRLILSLPHRDLYERKKELPSLWNGDHKHFWLPVRGEAPCTRGLLEEVTEALPNFEVLRLSVEDTGWFYLPPEQHAPGEFSIELVARKRA